MGGYHQIIFGGEMKNPQKQPDPESNAARGAINQRI